MRYIDAEKIKQKLNDKIINPQTAFINGVLIGLLDREPTADVVEVVRCKDCKYFNDIKHTCSLHSHELIRFQVSMEFNDYCSYGERKEQEQ